MTTDTEALAPPAAFQIHPALWIAKMIGFYYRHEEVFNVIGWAVLAALIYIVVMAVFMFAIHKLKHRDPPDDGGDPRK